MGEQVISEPGEEDIQRLAEQVARARELAVTHLGRKLEDDEAALDTLQALLDGGFIAASATYDLQCLGIVLGTQVADVVDDIDWAMVEDEYGRDPALRYLDTSLLVFPMTMISKRVEDGKRVDVRDIFDGIVVQIERLKGEVARPS